MWNLKYDMRELVCKGEIDSHREQTGGCQGQGRSVEGRAGGWGRRTQAIHMERESSKALPWGTGRPTQCHVINHNGKEHENRGSVENKQTKRTTPRSSSLKGGGQTMATKIRYRMFRRLLLERDGTHLPKSWWQTKRDADEQGFQM